MPYKELSLDSQVCFRLYTASRLVTQCYRPFLQKINLTYPQYLVMMILWEKDNIPVSDISHRLSLESNTTTPLLQRMEKDGIIKREKSGKDTRQTIVSLTKKGKELEEKAKDVPYCMMEYLKEKNISEKELVTIIPNLDKIINSLKHK